MTIDEGSTLVKRTPERRDAGRYVERTRPATGIGEDPNRRDAGCADRGDARCISRVDAADRQHRQIRRAGHRGQSFGPEGAPAGLRYGLEDGSADQIVEPVHLLYRVQIVRPLPMTCTVNRGWPRREAKTTAISRVEWKA